MTYPFRLAVCGTALAAGLWFLAGATAAPPTLPKETYKRVVEADIAKIKEHLKFIAAEPLEFNAKAAAWSVKTIAFTLVLNAEASGDAALREQALKVAEASVKLSEAVKPRPTMRNKDAVVASAKEVAALADKLAFKPGNAPLKPMPFFKDEKYGFDLWQAMTPFRNGDRGGSNIEKDIRDYVRKDNPVKLSPAEVEILAARVVTIGEFALAYPNDKANVNDGNKKEWKKLSEEMMEIGKQLAAEAGKGKQANEKELHKMLDALNGKCYKCHSDFRDE